MSVQLLSEDCFGLLLYTVKSYEWMVSRGRSKGAPETQVHSSCCAPWHHLPYFSAPAPFRPLQADEDEGNSNHLRVSDLPSLPPFFTLSSIFIIPSCHPPLPTGPPFTPAHSYCLDGAELCSGTSFKPIPSKKNIPAHRE